MHSVFRKLLGIVGLSCLVVSAGLPAPEFDVIAGSESAETGIYAREAKKHDIGTKLKAQAYAGADFHYDSNILLRRNNEESTFISAAILGARLLYEAPRLNASLLAQANGRVYSGFGNFAGVTGHVDARGEYNISDSSVVTVTDLFQYMQDPLDVTQDVRAERISNTLAGTFDTSMATWALRAGVVNTILDYNEKRFASQDYIMIKGFAEAAFDAPLNQEKLNLSETRAYVRVVATNYNHQTQTLNDLFVLGGELGVRGKWQTKVSWDLAFGAESLTVDEKPSNPADEDKMVIFAFDAQIGYLVTERTLITLAASRHGEVSQFSNYAIVTRASLGGHHFINEKFDVDVVLGYQYAQYSIADANLTRTNALLRGGYILNPMIRVYADYAFTNRDGDQAASEYQVHQIGAGVAAVF